MGIGSFIIGILALCGACVNLFPGLGWANCILSPFAMIGAFLGFFSLIPERGQKVLGGIGLALNAVAFVIAFIRFFISFLFGGFGIL